MTIYIISFIRIKTVQIATYCFIFIIKLYLPAFYYAYFFSLTALHFYLQTYYYHIHAHF